MSKILGLFLMTTILCLAANGASVAAAKHAGQARGVQYPWASMTVRTRSVFLGSVGSSDPNAAARS